MAKDPRSKRYGDSSARRVVSVTLTTTDMEILDWLTELLNVGKSEVIRAGFRAYAAQMAQVEKQMRSHDTKP